MLLVRPPGTQSELEFLTTCTGCGRCLAVCPVDALIPAAVPATTGSGVEKFLPVIDFSANLCVLCADTPCIAVCEPRALRFPGDAGIHLTEVRFDPRHCLPYQGPECGACADSCPLPGVLVFHDWKPVFELPACAGCGACMRRCPMEPKPLSFAPRSEGVSPSLHTDRSARG